MDANALDEVGGIIAAFENQLGDRRKPLAIIAHFRVREGTALRIEKAFAEASIQTATESGVLTYQLHRQPDCSNAFIVYERWRSLDDLEDHLRSPYIASLRAEIDLVMEGQARFQVMRPISF